jgi:ketosteroid isomerase-like protein
VSRLGPWKPATTEERLDRLESLAAIRQLVSRYTVAVDSRDLDALVDLFTADVRVGRETSGRAALKEWFTGILRVPNTTVHLVANHVVDFDDADHARGIVYCKDEMERPESGEWQIGAIQYWDSYVRQDGEWYFARRKFHRWYLVDALTRPAHGAGVTDPDSPMPAIQLPEAYPTWQQFWSGG